MDLVEKSNIDVAPTNIAITGRYILTPEIDNQSPGQNGEIQLTDALASLLKLQTILAYHFQGERYDVGDKLGFIKATIEFALERKELRQELFNYLNDLLKR